MKQEKQNIGDTVPVQWYLREKDFFHGLNPEKKAFLAKANRRTIKKNEFLFIEGDPGNSVFYLERGEVRIFRNNFAGKESIVFIRNAGEMFGLAEAIDGASRACSARAITACGLYEVSRENFESLLSRHWAFARRVMEVLGSRLRYLGEQVENLMSCDVTTRLIKLLYYFSCRTMLPDRNAMNNSVTFPVKLTQEQIAAMIGSCQQTVSEILKQLQQDGMVRISRRSREITILNPDSLRVFLS